MSQFYRGLAGEESAASVANKVKQARLKLGQQVQVLLDKATPKIGARWGALAALVLLYTIRVWWLRGFYIVTYGLGIYNLNLLIGFISPQQDPESEGPELPTKSDQEYKPFVRRLPEFKFWCVTAGAQRASRVRISRRYRPLTPRPFPFFFRTNHRAIGSAVSSPLPSLSPPGTRRSSPC